VQAIEERGRRDSSRCPARVCPRVGFGFIRVEGTTVVLVSSRRPPAGRTTAAARRTRTSRSTAANSGAARASWTARAPRHGDRWTVTYTQAYRGVTGLLLVLRGPGGRRGRPTSDQRLRTGTVPRAGRLAAHRRASAARDVRSHGALRPPGQEGDARPTGIRAPRPTEVYRLGGRPRARGAGDLAWDRRGDQQRQRARVSSSMRPPASWSPLSLIPDGLYRESTSPPTAQGPEWIRRGTSSVASTRTSRTS
jgi:hypothetical protein